MASSGAVGPYERLSLSGGGTVPLYLITFDKEGNCQSPLTLAQLLAEVKAGKYTDAHVFSHGWNNVFQDALGLYRQFFGHYFRLRDERGLNGADKYRPVAVGIIWPSTLLVAPWESTPQIAAIDPAAADEQFSSDAAALQDIAAAIQPGDVNRLYEFSERGPTLNPAEARELARILLPVYADAAANTGADPELAGGKPSAGDTAVTAEQLLALWQEMAPREARADQPPGFAPDKRDEGGSSKPADVPLTAGFLNWLDPRGPIRVASVLQMKDRAGKVGSTGVGPQLTQPLLEMNTARIHLIGHSYGAKVMLSSLCCQPGATRAASVLLLEPAISYLCFGQNLDGQGLSGGYRSALERVAQPVFSTFSASDIPLRRLFHLAVIRNSDWGEQKIAGLPPSRFAALGGYGPGGLAEGESMTIEMPAAGTLYPANPGIRIYGIDGSKGQITGHGNVATEFTAWAHLNLVSGPELIGKT